MFSSDQRPSMTPRRLFTILTCLVGACALALLCPPAVANGDDPRVKDTLTGDHTGQQFVAGERVTITNANVADDIFAAGKDVKFDTATAKLIVSAGASLWLTNVTAEDLILAGGQIDLSGTVTDDVIAAACPVCPVGGYVRLNDSMQVGDEARLVGREVQVDGKVGGNLFAAGQRVVLSGEVGGNAKFEAEHIVLERGARVEGNLRWAGPNAPELREGAVVVGKIVEVEPIFPFDKKLPEHAGWWYVMMGVAAVLGILLAFVLLGVALQLAAPVLLADAASTARSDMWSSLGRGLVVSLLGPAVVALLMASVVGIPIGLVAGAALLLLFALGYVAVSYCIGLYLRHLSGKSEVVSGTGGRIVLTTVGILVLFVVGLVPFIGWVIDFLAVTAGVGAVARQIGPRMRGRGAQAAGA